MSFKTLTFSELSELPHNIVFREQNQSCIIIAKMKIQRQLKNVFVKKRLLNKTFSFWSNA